MPRHAPTDLSSAAIECLLALRSAASEGRKVSAVQVACHLGVTTQAASEMFRRLAADGLRPAALVLALRGEADLSLFHRVPERAGR